MLKGKSMSIQDKAQMASTIMKSSIPVGGSLTFGSWVIQNEAMITISIAALTFLVVFAASVSRMIFDWREDSRKAIEHLSRMKDIE